MTIEKLKSGSYRISKVYQGKRYRVIVDHKPTDKEATILISEEVQRFHEKAASKSTFQGAYEKYCESRTNVCSPATLRGYAVLNRNMPEWFKNLNIYDIDQMSVQRMINEYSSTHSPKSTRNLHGLVSAVLKTVRPEIVLRTRLPEKRSGEVYIPSDAEVKAILQKVKGSKYEVALLLAVFGLRRSEICALTLDDLEGNMISVTKAKVQRSDESWVIKPTPKTEESNRKVYVTDYVRDLILRQGFIYRGHPENIRKKLEKVEDELGIRRFPLHKLRHYFASVTHDMQISDADIMAMGGWKTDHIMKSVYRHAIAGSVTEGQKKYADKISSMNSN